MVPDYGLRLGLGFTLTLRVRLKQFGSLGGPCCVKCAKCACGGGGGGAKPLQPG